MPASSTHAPRSGAARTWELVAHLARREVASRHRFTALGWTWPLARQLAQLAVLTFVFSAVFDLGIEDYPAFVFVGLITFAWFSSGVADASSSLLAKRHLVLQPRFPREALPLVALAVPLVDVLMALPVLLVMLIVSGDLSPHALLLPALLGIQLVLMCGLAWLTAAAAVYVRDIPNLVGVGLLMLFYVTPVFYDLERVPDKYREVLQINPLTTLVEAYRAVLTEGRLPDAGALAVVAAASALVAVAGLLAFRRLQGGFADEL